APPAIESFGKTSEQLRSSMHSLQSSMSSSFWSLRSAIDSQTSTQLSRWLSVPDVHSCARSQRPSQSAPPPHPYATTRIAAVIATQTTRFILVPPSVCRPTAPASGPVPEGDGENAIDQWCHDRHLRGGGKVTRWGGTSVPGLSGHGPGEVKPFVVPFGDSKEDETLEEVLRSRGEGVVHDPVVEARLPVVAEKMGRGLVGPGCDPGRTEEDVPAVAGKHGAITLQ